MKILAIFALVFLCPITSHAAVLLTSPTSAVSVNPGGTFTLTLNLNVTGSEQVTGISYYWSTVAGAAGDFSITNRTETSSPFSSMTASDSSVTASPGNSLILRSGVVRNNLDLGAGVADFNSPTSTGTWFVANYTFAVSGAAAPGTYALTSYNIPGNGWSGPQPTFASSDFNGQASILVTVTTTVPEPSGLIWVGGLFLLVIMVLRRRLARIES